MHVPPSCDPHPLSLGQPLGQVLDSQAEREQMSHRHGV